MPSHIRDSFRIDDKVHLSVRVLSEEECQQLASSASAEEGSLVNQLRMLTAQADKLLASLRKRDPDVAQYLSLLDRKIELLAAQVEGARDAGTLAADTRVNISAGGLAFWRDEPLAKGTKLELRLVLFPSYVRIHSLAEVMHAEEDLSAPSPSRFRIGVAFTRLGEHEKEALVRHIIELQSTQLRQQRGH